MWYKYMYYLYNYIQSINMMYSSCEAVQWTKLVAKQQMLCALL